MVKAFKKLIDKIKFKFTGVKQPDSKYEDTDYFRNIDLSRTVGAFSPKYYRCNKHTRYLVLRAAYGKDKIPLIKILVRTKKARIRRKLIKRISN